MKQTITSRLAYQGMEWRDEHGRARTGRVFRGEGGREPDKFSGHEYIRVQMNFFFVHPDTNAHLQTLTPTVLRSTKTYRNWQLNHLLIIFLLFFGPVSDKYERLQRSTFVFGIHKKISRPIFQKLIEVAYTYLGPLWETLRISDLFYFLLFKHV